MLRDEVLQAIKKVPWFKDLTEEQQEQMLSEFFKKIHDKTTRQEFTELLRAWSGVAHTSAKRRRLAILKKSNLLENPLDDEDFV